jgi:hypothetical protein
VGVGERERESSQVAHAEGHVGSVAAVAAVAGGPWVVTCGAVDGLVKVSSGGGVWGLGSRGSRV